MTILRTTCWALLFIFNIFIGKAVVHEINNIFSSVTQNIVPLQLNLESNEIPISQANILPKYIISEDDLFKKLSPIRISKSPGPDGIPNCVLKLYAPVLPTPVSSIF